jgi:DNA-binding transcriptional regulator YiaG
LRERFGLPALSPDGGPAFSSSNDGTPFLLRRIGPLSQPIDVVRRLRQAGTSLRVAHAALDRLTEAHDIVVRLPAQTDLASLAADLRAMSVEIRSRRVVGDAAPFLVEVRSRHGLSQRDFAELLGLDVRTLQNWEQGRNSPDAAVLNLVRLFDRSPLAVAEAAFEPVE